MGYSDYVKLSVFKKAEYLENVVDNFYDEIMVEINCKREHVETVTVLYNKSKKVTMANWLAQVMSDMVPG